MTVEKILPSCEVAKNRTFSTRPERNTGENRDESVCITTEMKVHLIIEIADWA
jgi:hypothetical protein